MYRSRSRSYRSGSKCIGAEAGAIGVEVRCIGAKAGAIGVEVNV